MSTFIIVSCGTARHNTVSMMFNSVVQMTVSFAKGAVRKPWINLTKALLCCLGFSVCLYLLFRINTIPDRNDEVKMESFKAFAGPMTLNLTLGHEYFGIGGRRDSGAVNYFFMGAVDPSGKSLSNYYSRNNQEVRDSLLKLLADTCNININKDSLNAVFNIVVKKDMGASPLKYNNLFVCLFPEYWDNRSKRHPDTLYRKQNQIIYNKTFSSFKNGHNIAIHNDIIALNKLSPDPKKDWLPIVDAEIKNTWDDEKAPYFILEDVSQSYYNLKLDVDDDYLGMLKIDFGGATRFTGIQPQPDQITMSGIVYTDKEKIDKIRRRGLRLYCQFLDTATLQSVRIFMLTAFTSLFFTLFWKYLYRLVVWPMKRRMEKEDRQRAMKK